MFKLRMFFVFVVILLNIISITGAMAATSESYPIARENLYVRDPFILVDEKSKTYFLYAAREFPQADGTMRAGVGVHTSKDLETWSHGYPVFEVIPGSWAEQDVWAPEVLRYKGKYYLFTTLTSDEMLDGTRSKKAEPGAGVKFKRGTQIFVADKPTGPFKPFYDRPTTRPDWMTLDGTLWVEDGVPYMVYCHEWAQIVDGTMDLIQLKDDLSATVGKNKVLFKASDAPWVISLKEWSKGRHPHGYITDGPWMHFTKTGRLVMIWSSFSKTGYSITQAYSKTGSIHGPWVQDPKPMISQNGGHGMIFKDLNGRLLLTLHYPNTHNTARAHFIEIDDSGDKLKLKSPFNPGK